MFVALACETAGLPDSELNRTASSLEGLTDRDGYEVSLQFSLTAPVCERRLCRSDLSGICILGRQHQRPPRPTHDPGGHRRRS